MTSIAEPSGSHSNSFDDLPAELRAAFGEPAFVMALKLDAERRLARVDVRTVLERLREPGYFLQLPPELPVEEEISRRFAGPVKD